MTRRRTIAAAVMVAGMAGPAPTQEPVLEFVFEERVALQPAIKVGPTAIGERTIIPIVGGTFQGPAIRGVIMPGGWDWQVSRADGCRALKADYMLKTDDGVIINVVNQGIICPGADPAHRPPVRTQAVFEPPLGKYAWLGQGAFVGALQPDRDAKEPGVRIRFYRVR